MVGHGQVQRVIAERRGSIEWCVHEITVPLIAKTALAAKPLKSR